MTIYFYTVRSELGMFSNFSKHGFTLDGKYWPTVEHYFQAQKFLDADIQEKFLELKKPNDASRMGRRRDLPLREDWESIKDDVMYRAVLSKFETHEDIRQVLFETGEEDIVENAPGDYYWGCGRTGTGRNQLGKTLVRVREELKVKYGEKVN